VAGVAFCYDHGGSCAFVTQCKVFDLQVVGNNISNQALAEHGHRFKRQHGAEVLAKAHAATRGRKQSPEEIAKRAISLRAAFAARRALKG
jgi:hypothetical protein